MDGVPLFCYLMRVVVLFSRHHPMTKLCATCPPGRPRRWIRTRIRTRPTKVVKQYRLLGRVLVRLWVFFMRSRSLARFEIKRTRTGWWARYGGKDDTAGVYGHQQQPSSSTRIAHSLCEKVLMIILSHCADEKRGFRSVCWAQSFCEEQQKQ